MYRIQLTCIDPPYTAEDVYSEFANGEFGAKDPAYMRLLECAIDEARSLNEPDTDLSPTTKVFVICRDYEYQGKKYPAAIIMWDGSEGIVE